jgi:DNA-binding SARP family transcriptional activator/tetratricopeptide (TPR) repeat protein
VIGTLSWHRTEADTRLVSTLDGAVRLRLSSTLSVDAGTGALAGRALGSRKARTLLALLAAARGTPVVTDRIVEALWHDEPPADPAANVATLISRLRRTVGQDVVVGLPGAYVLGGAWSLDLVEAQQWCAQAAGRAAADEHALAETAAAAAQDLLGSGPALPDEDDDDWVLEVRREVDALRRDARHQRVAALLEIDPARAVPVASAGVAPDAYDERAVRDLMRALAADGQVASALAAYDRLARTLREDLGTAPDRATADLHLALLRDPGAATSDRSVQRARPVAAPAVLLGRDEQVAVLRQAWRAAVAGEAVELMLAVGEGGIGKTRLLDAFAEWCAATGGQVLRGRCHPAERSLFLQPVVDAVRPALATLQRDALVAVVRDHEGVWATLLPDFATVVGEAPPPSGDRDLQRRATYDAVLAALRRLAVSRPVVLVVDDLQDGGAATVDLLGYLSRRLDGARVLLVAAVRSEGPAVAERLGDRVRRIALGPLDAASVESLAAAAGLSARGSQVMARTAGHTLSVVECLRALADGDTGVPASLSAAVLARVARLGAETRSVVEAGAVLRRRLDPRLLADLTELSELTTIRHAEELTRGGLFVRSGAVYEFANDLFQESVYAALPQAVATAHHRRAADLTSDRPEVMAAHAHAVGDDARAARGWLVAAEEALRRAAVEDARTLVEHCLAVPGLDGETRARALLVRGRVHEAAMRWSAAIDDIDAALAWARRGGERRLELAALRARGGDAAVGAQLGAEELLGPLEDGVRLAAELGDRRAEADFATRLTVLEASRLRLTDAGRRAGQVLARARASGSEDGVVLALDGAKTVSWYLGDADALADVVAELEPLVRARHDAWLLQWVVFESAFVPAADDRWDDARGLVAQALELNRRSGFPAYAGYLRAYDSWLARLAGDLDDAVRLGRRAVEDSSAVDHPWWHSWAAGLLAATLVRTGELGEAETVARAGLAARSGTARPGRLLCAAALAALTGEHTSAAVDALHRVDCPPGRAWVAGADAYLLLAGAAAARGDEVAAARLVAPLRAATAGAWPAVRRQVDELDHRTSRVSRAARSAPSEGTGR